MTNHYLLIIWFDVEPEIRGPFKSAEERDTKVLEIRFNEPDGDEAGIYPLDIESDGVPKAVTVDAYSGGFFEEEEIDVDFCPKCGQSAFAHNADGSCVMDLSDGSMEG
jgi:Tol biopolymer transport system component